MTQEVQESSVKRFFKNIFLGEIDVPDDSDAEFENTLEFSTLSASEQKELIEAQKSIDENAVDYATIVKKENKNTLRSDINKSEKRNAKDQKIVDYYSKPSKKKTTSKSKERDL